MERRTISSLQRDSSNVVWLPVNQSKRPVSFYYCGSSPVFQLAFLNSNTPNLQRNAIFQSKDAEDNKCQRQDL